MRRLYILLVLLCCSGVSTASTLNTWGHTGTGSNVWPSGEEACGRGRVPGNWWPVPANNYITLELSSTNKYDCKWQGSGGTEYHGTATRLTQSCPFGDNGSTCNASCDAPNIIDENGQCSSPPPDPCFSLYGQSKGFTLSGNSNDPGAFYQPITGSNYWTNPGTVVLGGCAATVETGTKCKVYGDGAYTCVGAATYQGVTADPSAGETESEECTGEACPNTEPTPTSGGSSECTNWVEDAEGRRTRTCETTSEASQSGQAACLTNGSLVCVSASPTPEKDTKTRTDAVAETPTADGGKSTETTSTTNKTYCAAGACTTTTTTNHSTTVTNGSGEVTSESGTCEGDDCAEPQTEEEENGEPGVTATVVGVEYPELGEDEAPEFGATAQVFLEKVQTIPFIQAARSVTIPQGGGNCIVGNLSLWGGAINMDGFCTMLPTVLNPLSYLFLAAWSFMALRILLSA